MGPIRTIPLCGDILNSNEKPAVAVAGHSPRTPNEQRLLHRAALPKSNLQTRKIAFAEETGNRGDVGGGGGGAPSNLTVALFNISPQQQKSSATRRRAHSLLDAPANTSTSLHLPSVAGIDAISIFITPDTSPSATPPRSRLDRAFDITPRTVVAGMDRLPAFASTRRQSDTAVRLEDLDAICGKHAETAPDDLCVTVQALSLTPMNGQRVAWGGGRRQETNVENARRTTPRSRPGVRLVVAECQDVPAMQRQHSSPAQLQNGSLLPKRDRSNTIP